MRYIWLIRHGKSEAGDVGMSDHERKLNPRGESDGQAMQAWLSAQPHAAEWVWSSSATRAQATAEYVADGFTAPINIAPELYLSPPEVILDVLRATPPSIESVAVVAHNPGLTYLTNLLAPESVTDNLITFGTALFATEADWPSLVTQHNHFISLHTPKTIDR